MRIFGYYRGLSPQYIPVSHREGSSNSEPLLESKLKKEDAEFAVSHRWHLLVVYLSLGVLGVTLTTITILYINLLRETAPSQLASCGASVAEAEAAGCTFDILTKSWLPATCDRHGTSNYLKIATWNNDTWTYWADKEGRREIDPTDMSRMAGVEGAEWWVTEREYLAYCAWINVRMAHGVSTGSNIDQITRDYEHSRHCTLLLLQWAWQAPGLDGIKSRGRSVFGSC